MTIWNPWHGCRKYSSGCLNCYMFRRDEQVGRDPTVVYKTADFDLPVKRKRDGSYKLVDDETVYACMTSDFFLEEADEWRREAWRMIKARPDLSFTIITKRIDRFSVSLPADWGEGYENVTVCSTCENQREADRRLPLLLSAPLRRREIIMEPMLESIDVLRYLRTGEIKRVVCGGESGENARPLLYDWVLAVRDQCLLTHTPFIFKQTGARFVKDGKTYLIERALQHGQAKKAHIDFGG